MKLILYTKLTDRFHFVAFVGSSCLVILWL